MILLWLDIYWLQFKTHALPSVLVNSYYSWWFLASWSLHHDCPLSGHGHLLKGDTTMVLNPTTGRCPRCFFWWLRSLEDVRHCWWRNTTHINQLEGFTFSISMVMMFHVSSGLPWRRLSLCSSLIIVPGSHYRDHVDLGQRLSCWEFLVM